MNTFKKLFGIALVATLVYSCDRTNDDPLPPIDIPDVGLLILNEGAWGMNNGDITLFDFETETATQDVFFRQNNRHLGDTPSDILVYGSRIFITVGGSSTLEITDLQLNSITGEPIPLRNENNVARNPRGLASHNGKVYFALFDGYLARLDTATFALDFVRVGQNPENIVIRNNFAYVTNSGGFDSWMERGGDSTVSVIDLATFQKVDSIIVGLNPVSIGVDQNGNIIVGCASTSTLPGRVYRIRPDRTVDRFPNIDPSGFVINRSSAFAFGFDWATSSSSFVEFNTSTGNITNPSFLADPSLVALPHGIAVNPQNRNIYVADVVDFSFSAPGKVFVFNESGEYQFSFDAGIAPKRIVIF